MDKILAFSILSSSPADIAAGGYWTRLSGRSNPEQASQKQAEQKQAKQQRANESSQPKKQHEMRPRFAPEFDGINCFETIVSH